MVKINYNMNFILVLSSIAVGLLLVIFTYVQRFSWENADAADYLRTAVSKWGKPAHLSRKKGGFAIWNKEQLKNTCFDLIELRDESVPHCVPLPHSDFL